MDVACQKVKQLPCMVHADFMDVCTRIMHTILESIMYIRSLASLAKYSSRGFGAGFGVEKLLLEQVWRRVALRNQNTKPISRAFPITKRQNK